MGRKTEKYSFVINVAIKIEVKIYKLKNSHYQYKGLRPNNQDKYFLSPHINFFNIF